MKTIVCYGDSNTWGDPPGGIGRHSWEVRWPGVLQSLLGDRFRIIEEGLNGRTAASDDPNSPLRNGLTYLPIVLETHSPIDLLIIMLGTNELKAAFALSAFQIAEGARRLITLAQSYGSNIRNILLISPPHIVSSSDVGFEETFRGAIEKSRELGGQYQRVAQSLNCRYLDGAAYARSSEIDGIHMNAKEHAALAEGIAEAVKQIINEDGI